MPLASRAPIRGSQRLGVRLPLHAMADDRPVGRRQMSTVVSFEPTQRTRRVTPVRLRHLLALATLVLAAQALVPRALAYWRLHGTATQFANYALCMVGPTGPVLLRDRPADFWRLVRRRLVASPPEARPFAACVPALDALGDELARRRFHQAKAQDFGEFATVQGSLPSPLSIQDLSVTTARLDDLARAAWPFASPNYTELVQPSRNARTVPHPVELAPPAEGHGLPTVNLGYAAISATEGGYLLVAGRDANLSAYRSRDGGRTWAAVETASPTVRANSGRCSVPGTASAFRLSLVGEQLRVESWLNGEPETSFPLASTDSRLLGFSCDATAVFALVRDDESTRPTFRLCPHLERCRDVAVPTELRGEPSAGAIFSVARVKGVAVISVANRGIVRVISSRDDGETWTPSVVAYDAREYAGLPHARVTPAQLLGLGDRVLLYAGADSPTARYPVLFSDDIGASWRGQ
jgi:hypothetical protein